MADDLVEDADQLFGPGVLEAVAARVAADGAAHGVRAVDVGERAEDARGALVDEQRVVAAVGERGGGLGDGALGRARPSPGG